MEDEGNGEYSTKHSRALLITRQVCGFYSTTVNTVCVCCFLVSRSLYVINHKKKKKKKKEQARDRCCVLCICIIRGQLRDSPNRTLSRCSILILYPIGICMYVCMNVPPENYASLHYHTYSIYSVYSKWQRHTAKSKRRWGMNRVDGGNTLEVRWIVITQMRYTYIA